MSNRFSSIRFWAFMIQWWIIILFGILVIIFPKIISWIVGISFVLAGLNAIAYGFKFKEERKAKVQDYEEIEIEEIKN